MKLVNTGILAAEGYELIYKKVSENRMNRYQVEKEKINRQIWNENISNLFFYAGSMKKPAICKSALTKKCSKHRLWKLYIVQKI